MKTLIAQGAEAKIYLDILADSPTIYKQRIPKSYRLPQLDEKIRKSRTKSEAKILEKAGKIINTPKVNKIDKDNKTLHLEFIEGDRFSETLNSYPGKKQFEIMKQLGKQVAKLHHENIIHGDLTTSNAILKKESQSKSKSRSTSQTKEETPVDNTLHKQNSAKFLPEKLFIIDFGLSYISQRIEDKAVDIHLIKQALEAKHFQNHKDLFKEFEKGYLSTNKQESKKVLEQLKKVEARGRYKH